MLNKIVKVSLLLVGIWFLGSMGRAEEKLQFDYSQKTKSCVFDYGNIFSIECTGVNKIDYSHSIMFQVVQPSPQANSNPSGIQPKGGDELLESISNDLIVNVNKYLVARATKFGQDAIADWYNKLKDIFSEDNLGGLKDFVENGKIQCKAIVSDEKINTNIGKRPEGERAELIKIINKIKVAIELNDIDTTKYIELKTAISELNDKGIIVPANNNILLNHIDVLNKKKAAIEKEANKISEILDKQRKSDSAILVVGQEAIAKHMLLAKPGGGIQVDIEASFSGWRITGTYNNSKQENEYKLEPIKLEDVKDEAAINKIKSYCEPREIQVKFPGPKSVTYSSGPFFSVLLRRVKYARVKNWGYVEGGKELGQTDKYVVGYEENSGVCYGIASYWNASLEKIFGKEWKDIGVCWGIAYNFQNKIDNAINGLMGLCVGAHDSPVLLHIGVIFGFVDELQEKDSTETKLNIGMGIGENEEIPIQKKLKGGAFLSISFRFSN
jgi:hypothetical protein